MNESLRPLKDVSSLADRAYEAIRDAILRMTLKPGEPLVETKLANALATSKTPIRQALKQLEQTGLVVAIPYKGYFVSELSLKDAYEILQIRAVLEGLAAGEACHRLNEADLTALGDMLDRAEAALTDGRPEESAELGHRFHQILIDKAQNRRLASMISVLSDQFHRVRLLSAQVPGRLPRSIQEHRKVFEALRDGDAERADLLMRQHLLAVYQDVEQDDALTNDGLFRPLVGGMSDADRQR